MFLLTTAGRIIVCLNRCVFIQLVRFQTITIVLLIFEGAIAINCCRAATLIVIFFFVLCLFAVFFQSFQFKGTNTLGRLGKRLHYMFPHQPFKLCFVKDEISNISCFSFLLKIITRTKRSVVEQKSKQIYFYLNPIFSTFFLRLRYFYPNATCMNMQIQPAY